MSDLLEFVGCSVNATGYFLPHFASWQITRPSIMKRERKESEDSEDPLQGYAMRLFKFILRLVRPGASRPGDETIRMNTRD